MTIRDIMERYLFYIQTGDYTSLEQALKKESFDLSNAEEIVVLQQFLVEQKTLDLISCNLAILEAYLSAQPDRQRAYNAFRSAAKIASSNPSLSPKAELSVILLD